MTDSHPILGGSPSSPESPSQLVASLSIIATLAAIAVGLIIAGVISKDWSIVSPLLGTELGILGTALNTPSGIGKVIGAARQPVAPNPPQQGTAT